MDLLVGVSTGVTGPLLSKLSMLLDQEYGKLKGVHKHIKSLRDELTIMNATLQMIANSEELNPQMKDWRDKVRELAYDMEDCIDEFITFVDHEHDGLMASKGFFHKLKKVKARYKIASQIKELKTCAVEVSKRQMRYNIVQSTPSSSTSSIDPRLPALYEEVDRLVDIDGPKKHIIECLTKFTEGSSTQLKVVSIVGCGGLGKTTLAKQVYQTIKSQSSCSTFVSVSRNPNMKKILRNIAEGVGIIGYTTDDDIEQVIDKFRKHLQCKRYVTYINEITLLARLKVASIFNNCFLDFL